MNEDIKYLIALTQIEGVGSILARRLIEELGSAEAVFKGTPEDVAYVDRLPKKVFARIKKAKEAFEKAEEQIGFCDRKEVEIIPITSKRYPYRLKNTPDAPLVLYFKGSAEMNPNKVISVVGTRRATNYGKEQARTLIQELADEDLQVVSGLALGIDGIAHQTSVDLDIPTIGVLGHGLDVLYPAAHRNMAARMIENGGLLTEFPINTIPEKENFPKRNRIIAGMGDATIVVESRISGGSMITADIAVSYGRDVGAFPGRATDFCSEGTNELIRSNKAFLMTSANDLRQQMGWEPDRKIPEDRSSKRVFNELEGMELIVANLIQENGRMTIDRMAQVLDKPVQEITVSVTSMEIMGIVRRLPGNLITLP